MHLYIVDLRVCGTACVHSGSDDVIQNNAHVELNRQHYSKILDLHLMEK